MLDLIGQELVLVGVAALLGHVIVPIARSAVEEEEEEEEEAVVEVVVEVVVVEEEGRRSGGARKHGLGVGRVRCI